MAVKSSFKNMTICLLAICLVCSGLLAGVYALTKSPIDAASKAKNEAAIKEVLPENAVTIEEEKTIDVDGFTYTYNRAFLFNKEESYADKITHITRNFAPRQLEH